VSVRPPTRALALLVSVAAVCSGLVVGAGPPSATGSRVERGAHLTDCVPTGPRRTVAEINRFVDTAPGRAEFLGADVGVDVRLPRGRSLWFFADTLRRSSDEPLVRNSMLLFSPDCVQVVLAPGGGAIVPERDDGVGYWPMSTWRRGPDSAPVVYLMLQRVAATTADESGSGFGFATLGPAVAVFDISPEGLPSLRQVLDLGPDDADGTIPEWGAASALDRGWLYLYGTSARQLPGIHGFALRVARVRPDRVLDLDGWEYWAGSSWTPDPDDAIALIPEEGGVSQTLSVWKQQGRWYALSKQDEFLGTRIVVWPGESPVGPFGPAVAVADLPCDAATGELRYMPLAHPDLLPFPDTVVVSYSRNYLSVAEVCARPLLYRPHFLRVSLPP